MEVPVARRAGAPPWVNARTALGIILFAVAVLAGQRVLADADRTVSVWAAARDLPSGAVLGPDDLAVVGVQLPSDLLSSYAAAGRPLDGLVLTRPVHAGELIAGTWIADGTDGVAGGALTIPVTPEHSVGGLIAPGDRIDVLATFDAGDARARTVTVVRGVEVVGVVTAGGLIGEEGVIGITVATGDQDAARLAFAIRNADLDIVRVVGAPAEGEGDTVRAGDFP